jgi:acetyl esterase/lipase
LRRKGTVAEHAQGLKRGEIVFDFDPELKAFMAKRGPAGDRLLIERGDWKTRRENWDSQFSLVAKNMPEFPDVERKSFYFQTKDRESIEVRWFKKIGATTESAVVYAHGGGKISGLLDNYDPLIARCVSLSEVPFLVVDYRLAPEYKGTVSTSDAYESVLWLIDNAAALGIDKRRIAVMGDSGGGGVAAGCAILARNNGIALKKQILIYPMLDDRNIKPDPHLEPFSGGCTYDDNYTCWYALLGEDIAGDNVSSVAAPSRNKDWNGLPPAYIEVGELDIFRDESVQYACNLWRVGISAELHVYPGCPHGFDMLPIQAAKRAYADRLRVLKSL